MLASLPRDILRLALEDFLAIDVFGLSCLDVAFCNHQHRADAIRALREVRLHEVTPRHIQGSLYKIPDLNNYMAWISKRKVLVRKMVVYLSRIEDIVPRELPDVEELEFIPQWEYDTSDGVVHIPSLAPFIACFPNLKRLRCWQDIKDLALQQFYGMTCPLELLDLSRCYHLSPDVVVALVSLVKNSLRELRCDCLGHRALKELAKLGLRLKRLEISYQLLRNFMDSLSLLVASLGKTLEDLELKCNATPEEYEDDDRRPSILEFTLFQDLAKSCPHLRVLKVDSDSCDLPLHEMLTAVLTGCLAIECIEFEGYHSRSTDIRHRESFIFHFSNRNGTRLCDMKQVGSGDKEPLAGLTLILSSVAACAVSLRKFCWAHGNIDKNFNCLRTLLEFVGPEFEELEVDFYLGNQDLGDFFCRCPNLTSLSICGDSITGARMASIPRYCPKLSALGLKWNKLSDSVVCDMLDVFRGGHLRTLTLNQSTPLIVEKITEVLPRLHSLTITSSMVDQKHMLSLLLSRTFQDTTVMLDWNIVRWLKEELKAAGMIPLPKVMNRVL